MTPHSQEKPWSERQAEAPISPGTPDWDAAREEILDQLGDDSDNTALYASSSIKCVPAPVGREWWYELVGCPFADLDKETETPDEELFHYFDTVDAVLRFIWGHETEQDKAERDERNALARGMTPL